MLGSEALVSQIPLFRKPDLSLPSDEPVVVKVCMFPMTSCLISYETKTKTGAAARTRGLESNSNQAIKGVDARELGYGEKAGCGAKTSAAAQRAGFACD